MVHEVHEQKNNTFTYIQYSCNGQKSKQGEQTIEKKKEIELNEHNNYANIQFAKN